MKKIYNLKTILFVSLTAASVIIWYSFSMKANIPSFKEMVKASAPEELNEAKERDEYFQMLLRDPATGKIPPSIRKRELQFAKLMSEKNKLNKVFSTQSLNWKEAGPYDVGGRTRALAVDITNSNTIIAGGISGGIWKSTDNGQTWKIKSTTSQLLSVTSLAQDPRAGHTDTWYYTTGEFSSNSATDQGFTAFFFGNGVFKSTDNGESWNVLQSTTSPNPTAWDGDFDYAIKVVVHPVSGNVYVAENGAGIFRSKDGGNTFTNVLGGTNEHIFSDVAVSSDGKLAAIISVPFQGVTAKDNPGIYKSVNDGDNWTNITPNNFPQSHYRSVLAFAPSNTNVFYSFTNTGNVDAKGREDVRFYKLNFGTGAAEDRTSNLPDFSAQGGVAEKNGFLTTQGNYDMVLAVKPDDENFILIAGTCLFRTTDGFATKPTDMKNTWIGGYNTVTFGYPNFHPDIHSFAFDPTNPNKMWWGNDGGLTYTTDVRNNSFADYFPWEKKNNGYNVTQFYMVAIPDKPNDNRLMGGAQDNGSPFFTFDGTTTSASTDVSSGDGSYAYFGQDFAYTSSQKGNVVRVTYDNLGKPDFNLGWSSILPKNATNQLFITPFVVDPVDENVMYYPASNVLWRNNQLGSIPNFEQSGTTVGWSQMTVSVPEGYLISTLMASKNPGHVLYYGLSSRQDPPKIYRLENSNTANGPGQEISVPNSAQGAYVHHIAVNPDDANEIIVVYSNYNVVGLYHSSNGGQTYEPIEGNLEGTQQNPGPSIRAASILPTNNGNLYLVATSIGVFSTSQLNGANTNWVQEGANEIGNVVVNYIASRKSDGKIVAATHGRGMFVTNSGSSTGNAVASVNSQQLNVEAKPGQKGSTNFILSNTGTADLNFNITANGRLASSFKPNTAMINVLAKPVPSGFSFSNNSSGNKPGYVNNDSRKFELKKSSPTSGLGTDILVLDDGNQTSDDFFGWGTGSNFAWVNEFDLGTKGLTMDSFEFYMRTETALTNDVYVAVMDDALVKIAEGTITFNLSSQGEWLTVNLNPALNFTAGKKFYILVETDFSFIAFPAGVDKNGLVTGKSFYVNEAGTALVDLSGTNGFQNGAFLIRAVGTLAGGGGNQNPTAIASVSKTTAQVGESINFDASQSFDNDGQIVQYSWNFGDQTTSSQKMETHSYNQPNVYTFTLTVTDDKGGTGQTQAQITVTGGGNSKLTAIPSSGSIAPGGSMRINIIYDANGVPEGNYQGQVIINSNGGNITLPVSILVNANAVGVDDVADAPKEFFLKQNFPNPFNPTTIIKYSIPQEQHVKIIVYDINGKEVSELVNSKQSAGTYEIAWDGKNRFGNSVSSGVYFYSINSGSFTQTRKMVLMR
ncbi:MAG: PKD domain-containing protein [Ignavibacteriales bacterium]|nr:PKD domain-containing protein [Ignavibacteriales bacterium]